MSETAPEAWSRCRGFIEGALAQQGGGHTLNDVIQGIEEGRFHFWPGQGCALITEFWNEPHMRTLNLWLVGGDLREALAIVPHAEAFAKANGCGRMASGVAHGRRAWDRIGKGLGMAPRWTIYAKELS